MHLKLLILFLDIFLFFIIYIHFHDQSKSIGQLIQTHATSPVSILPYIIITFKLNGNVWALTLATYTKDDDGDVKNEFRIGDEDPITVLDRYLGGGELKEMIMEGRIFSIMIRRKGPHKLISSIIFNLKNIQKLK
jgi:hypothetical protein